MYSPISPYILLNACQETIHKDIGIVRPVKSIMNKRIRELKTVKK